MDFQEAFEILKLPTDATNDRILKQFRELSKKEHPDHGGSNENQTNLSIAKDIALTYSNKTQLVPIEAAKNFITKDLILFQKRAKEIEKTQNQITHRYVSKYKKFKNITGFIGIFTGALTLITNFFDKGVIAIAIAPTMNLLLIGLTFGMGFYYWFFSTMTESIKNDINDALDELDDKEIFASIANEIILPNDRQRFTKSQLIHLIASWLGQSTSEEKNVVDIPIIPIFSRPWSIKKLAQKIGIKDFSKIFIIKGLENGMLEEKEMIDDQSNFSIIYSLNISINNQQ